MKHLLIITGIFVLIGCTDSTIRVRNNLSGALMRNAEWGGVPLASRLMPGETSGKVEFSGNYNYYDIDLPEKHTVKFYLDVNGDMVYLQTKEVFKLGINDDKVIEINDSTQVVNPLLGSQASVSLSKLIK